MTAITIFVTFLGAGYSATARTVASIRRGYQDEAARQLCEGLLERHSVRYDDLHEGTDEIACDPDWEQGLARLQVRLSVREAGKDAKWLEVTVTWRADDGTQVRKSCSTLVSKP